MQRVELLVDIGCEIGEAPLWHAYCGLLYWLDIPKGRIYTYDPTSCISKLVHEGEPIGGFTIQADGSLLLFMKAGKIATWNDGIFTALIDSIPGSEDTLFNDTIADPKGRVFAGMKAGNSHKGQLYRVDSDGSLHLLLGGLGEPNGMGFTPGLRSMYLTDTIQHEIFLFDYDMATGAIANQRTFIRVPENDGIPDGLIVDSEGSVWSAHWDGACIVKYSPDGKETERVEIPAAKVSSLTFGGMDYSQLFITTSGGDKRKEAGSLDGSIFTTYPRVKGVPEFRSRVTLDSKK